MGARRGAVQFSERLRFLTLALLAVGLLAVFLFLEATDLFLRAGGI